MGISCQGSDVWGSVVWDQFRRAASGRPLHLEIMNLVQYLVVISLLAIFMVCYGEDISLDKLWKELKKQKKKQKVFQGLNIFLRLKFDF